MSVRGSQTKEITNKSDIWNIVSFIDSHKNGWTTPWYGVPVPALTLEFFDGNTFKGSFGAGVNFFETQREGELKSMGASTEELHDFLTLLNLSEDALKWR